MYFTPLALFFAGYFLALALTDSTAIQYLTAGLGFAAGILTAVAYDRKLRARGGISFTIVRLF